MRGYNNGFKAQLTTVNIPYKMEDEMVFYNIICYVLRKHNVGQLTAIPNENGIAFVQMRSFSKAEHDKVLRCAKELVKYQKGAVLIAEENYDYKYGY